MLARRLGQQRIGYIQHLLGRAVVLRQRDRFRRRLKGLREPQDIFHRRGAERVDRLRIVADHRQSRAVGFQCMQDLRLQLVGVLVFIHQHVVEVRADVLREVRLGHHPVPVEQQVVVVEERGVLLLLHVTAVQPGELIVPLRAPRKVLLEGFLERRAGVHAVRVDRKAGVLARKTLLGGRKSELLAQRVHEVRGIRAVDHAEVRIKLQVRGVVAQQAVAD